MNCKIFHVGKKNICSIKTIVEKGEVNDTRSVPVVVLIFAVCVF